MTTLARDRKTDQLGTPDIVMPQMSAWAMAVALIYAGSLVGVNAAGNLIRGSADPTLTIVGVAEKQLDNTGGSAGDLTMPVNHGVFYFNVSGTAPTAADVGKLMFVVDDNTVSLDDAGGQRPPAGYLFQGPRADGQAPVFVGAPSLRMLNPEADPSAAANEFRARAVHTTNVADLTAFPVATNNDGVTLVAGDVVLLVAQTTAAQNGPYVVGTVGGGNAPLVRPDWWSATSTQKTGRIINLGPEGTVFKNTDWKAMHATDSVVVDTTDPEFYPLAVSGATALVAGTFTISTVPIFSASSQVVLTRKVANTSTATTGGYHATNGGADGITPGKIGTAAAIVQATVAAGTINVADVSTLHWTVLNQA